MCLQQLKQYQLKVSRGIAVRFQEEGSSSESSAANLGLSYLLFWHDRLPLLSGLTEKNFWSLAFSGSKLINISWKIWTSL